MKWKVLNKLKAFAPRNSVGMKSEKLKVNEVAKILLANRGIKAQKQIAEFLNPPTPELLTPKDVGISLVQLNKAVKRIKKAIANKEKIIVYGDYDADGVCATAILWETIYKLGANVMPFIPTREEGYGMKVDRVEEFFKEGIKLIITVDQGIVAFEAAKKAKKLKIDLIISDHHVVGKSKPPALAIIHTTQLSGTGVAWFLARHLNGKDILDLATIGTIADMVPLLGPNRSIVKHGLKEVRSTKRIGLANLYRLASIEKEKIGTYEVGYLIGPRLNAAGRMDDPMDSLRLVCTPDKKRAQELATRLNERNRQRQELMKQTTIHARELWFKEDGKSALIFVSHESYQEGIVGLVAGRLMEEFYRPAIIIARGKKFSRASCRSIEEFNIVEAIRVCSDLLGSHGGHPKAAGFSVETKKIEVLKRRLIKIAEAKLNKEKLSPTLKIDLELLLEDLDFDFYRQLAQLEPFGEGNPQPVFASRKVQVIEARTVGNGSRHLKMRVAGSKSGGVFGAIAFNMGNLSSQLSPEKPIDIAYNLSLDEWNGQRRLQLKLKDLKIK